MGPSIFNDQPGTSISQDDWLKRGPFCDSLVRLLRQADKQSSVVFALYGQFGEGKTTILNFVTESLNGTTDPAKPVLIPFSPWIFSNTEHLLRAFFSQVGQTMGLALKSQQNNDAAKASEAFKKLGTTIEWTGRSIEALELLGTAFGLPGVATTAGRGIRSVGSVAKDGAEATKPPSETTVEQDREECQKALDSIDQPLVVVLDDFDRLTPDEVLLMMQLIKATANFKGLHYLIVADRLNLEKHLESKALPPSYLEKIVQYDLTVPSADPMIVRTRLRDAFVRSVNSTLNQDAAWTSEWDELFREVWQPFFRTIRSVKRFLATFEFYREAFSDGGYSEVHLVDLWSVEMLRVFAPESYRLLAISHSDLYPKKNLFMNGISDDQRKSAVTRREEIIAIAPVELRPHVEKLLRRVLPENIENQGDDKEADARKLRMRSPNYFPAYFRIDVPETMASQSDLFTWAKLAETGDTAALIAAINSSAQSLRLPTIARAVHVRWSIWSDVQRKIFCAALADLEDTSLRGGHRMGPDYLVWNLIENGETQTVRFSLLKWLLANIRGASVVIEVLTNDQRRAWQGVPTLFSRRTRQRALRAASLRIAELSTTGDLMRAANLESALGVWANFGDRRSLRTWLGEHLGQADKALNLLGKLGSNSETATFNGKTKKNFFYVPAILNQLWPTSFAKMGRSFRRFQDIATESETKRIFDGAAWCADRAAEDTAEARQVKKRHPAFFHCIIWLPEALRRSSNAPSLLVIPGPLRPEWRTQAEGSPRSIPRYNECHVAPSVNSLRQPATAILCKDVSDSKRVLRDLGELAGWLLHMGCLWVVEANTESRVLIGREMAFVLYDLHEQLIPPPTAEHEDEWDDEGVE